MMEQQKPKGNGRQEDDAKKPKQDANDLTDGTIVLPLSKKFAFTEFPGRPDRELCVKLLEARDHLRKFKAALAVVGADHIKFGGQWQALIGKWHSGAKDKQY